MLSKFLEKLPTSGTILELGTRRWGPEPTHHAKLWPHLRHIGVDIQNGLDVDVVCDVEKLTSKFEPNSVDAIFSGSTFEHVSRPWIAAREILEVLKPGGLFFVQSHQTFPLHGYPCDYYRYTEKAWPVLFEGCSLIESWHEFPCDIVPRESHVWDSTAKSFLNSCCWGIK
jgi:SAM-dependent methyltransferase